jgi:DNA-binding beta-propeller fold protein YncE
MFGFLRRRSFSIDAGPGAVQQLLPRVAGQRFEGIAFSPSGTVLATATSETDEVLLFRRGPDGRFDTEPYAKIGGLNYPHDVSFAHDDRGGLLAVAQRGGSVAVFAENGADGSYGPNPACVISGPESRLEWSDGVSFVPPHNDWVAACNLSAGTIGFYRCAARAPLRFNATPDFELTHPSLAQPDGLGFSRDGQWLATANHGGHSISIFERNGATIEYGPEPVAVITDPWLRHPHSVAFTDAGYVICTNAGANTFNVYRLARLFPWSIRPEPVLRQTVNDETAFQIVNSHNKMEGGPKGIAIHDRTIAVCSPEIGIKLYSFRE